MNNQNQILESFDTAIEGHDISDPSFWNNPMFDDPGAAAGEGVDMDVSPGPAGMEGAGFDAHGWRDANASSPPHSPATFAAPLPLGTDSPSVPTYDNFDAPAFPTFRSAETSGSAVDAHNSTTAFQQAQRMFGGISTQQPPQNQSPSQSQAQPVLTYTRPTMMYPAGGPNAPAMLSTSPPNSSDHLRRQAAMISSGAQAPVPSAPAMQAQGSHGPSPLGRYYLASSDPNRVNVPIAGGSPVIPNLPPMGGTRQSPTLSMASDDTFVPLEGGAPMFPPIAGVGMSRVVSGGGRLPPHMVPLPPSPAYPYGQPRTSFDHGSSPLSRVEDAFVSTTPVSDPTRLRQTTADSFDSLASTSSEEEEMTSPMILPDTSMARRRSAAGSTGRGSPRFTVSPRSPVIGNMGGASGSGVRGKMFGPIPSQAQFTFQAPGRKSSGGAVPNAPPHFPERPSFAPMSSSSSDNGDSDDDYIRSKSEEAADEKRRMMGAGNRWAQRAGGGMYDAEGTGGEGGADANAFRSQSITVGGSGYVDQSQYGANGGGIGAGNGGGSDDGGDDPDRPRNNGKPIIDAFASPLKKEKGKDKEDQSNRDPNLPSTFHNASESEEDDDAAGGEDADGEDGEGEYVAEGSNGQKKRKKNKGGEKDGDGKKRRKSVVGEGEVVCDYIELEPPYQKCSSRFHRTYDLQRHRETIHARNEGRLVSKGKLKLEDAKQFLAFGQPQIEWPCPFNCGQIFSRKDAMQRHLKTKKH